MEIKIGRTYRTRNGRKVTVHNIVEENGAGEKVTFPVKGTLWKHEDKIGRNPIYNIWTIDGRASVFSESDLDLVEEIGD